MASLYITNAFSLNMLPASFTVGGIDVRRLSAGAAYQAVVDAERAGGMVVPAVGHADTARVLAADLGLERGLMARVSVTLADGDSVLVGQYVGSRLAEGATTLPEGARIEWFMIQAKANAFVLTQEEARQGGYCC